MLNEDLHHEGNNLVSEDFNRLRKLTMKHLANHARDWSRMQELEGSVKNFVLGMLDPHPENRPTAEKVYKFFKNLKREKSA